MASCLLGGFWVWTSSSSSSFFPLLLVSFLSFLFLVFFFLSCFLFLSDFILIGSGLSWGVSSFLFVGGWGGVGGFWGFGGFWVSFSSSSPPPPPSSSSSSSSYSSFVFLLSSFLVSLLVFCVNPCSPFISCWFLGFRWPFWASCLLGCFGEYFLLASYIIVLLFLLFFLFFLVFLFLFFFLLVMPCLGVWVFICFSFGWGGYGCFMSFRGLLGFFFF